MPRDNRDPERLGTALLNLKKAHPKATAAERADMLDEAYKISIYAIASGNGKLTGNSAGH